MTRPAAAHRSAPRKRAIRAAKTGSAATAIGPVTPGMEVFVLTFGQFSIVDALVHLLGEVGPADVVISTWTAADADLHRAAALLEAAEISRLRWIVDRSFVSRQPDYCATMRRLFGDGCIRTVRSHAKFITIRAGRFALAVRTSMNLNENPRLENIEISDDPALCGFLEGVADELFAEQPAGEFDGQLPLLAGLPDAGAHHGVTRVGIAKV